jgi:hypothetical protein
MADSDNVLALLSTLSQLFWDGQQGTISSMSLDFLAQHTHALFLIYPLVSVER